VSAELWICRGATFFGSRRMRAMRQSKGCAKESKAVLTHSTPKLFPLASELQGALADGFAEGFVGRNGVEPFASPLIWSNQKLIECS